MVNTYRLILIPQYFMCGIPIWLSAIAVRDHSIWLALFAIVALLTLLCVMPICRGRESLFTFLILTAMGFPVNIRVITYLWANEFLGDPFWLSGILWSIVIIGILTSIEQIVLGTLVRALWPRQLRTRSSRITAE